MATLTENTTPHDFIIHEDDERYSRDIITFTNETGAITTFLPGEVLKIAAGAGTIAEAGETAAGILISKLEDVAIGATVECLALVRAALVNGDKLDFNTSVVADSKVDLLAIGIKCMDEPAKVEILEA